MEDMITNKNIFFITQNFSPNYDDDFLLLHDNIYKHISSGTLYKKRLLFDFGWGQEFGYVVYPEPTFEQLISIIEYVPKNIKNNPFFVLSKQLCQLNNLCINNAFGAISLIMQDHVVELIDYLKIKIESDYFTDIHIRKRFRHFCFDSEKAKKFGILVGHTAKCKPFEQIFKEQKGWHIISERVIAQVYK